MSKIIDVGAAYDKQFERVEMSDNLRAAAQAALYEFRNAEWNGWNPIIKKLEAALAKPDVQESLTVAEPIAWLVTYGNFTHVEYTKPNMVVDTYYQPLYTSPLAEQKPMLEMNPEKREWVGLTGDEVNLIYAEPQTHVGQYAKAIEAKLREKNT
jgi:hypothetical protein